MMKTKMRKNITWNKKNKLLLMGCIALLVTLLAVGGWLYYRHTNQSKTSNVIEGAIPGEKIDLSPPTEEEKRQVEENKERLVERQQQEGQTPANGTKQVAPFITDAAQYGQQVEVRAYIPGIFESGGTCKAVFTKAAQTITKETNAEKNVSNTTCRALIINRSEFPSAGDWSLVLTYTSGTAQGSSESKMVRVN
jgi:hypothetical protein